MVKRLILIFVALFAIVQFSRASHLMGGEITWECAPSGQFIFYMKLYRDCNSGSTNGLGAFNSIDVWNHPTMSNITVNLQAVNDISPACGGAGPNISCSNPGTQLRTETVRPHGLSTHS